MKKPLIIYGVPGTGKTYLSENLSKEKGCKLVELDKLRDIAKNKFSFEEKPFCYYGTTEAYQYYGKQIYENIIKGLRSVRETMQPFIEEYLNTLNSEYIAECAFIDPHYAKSIGDVILVVKRDYDIHKEQFFKHREESIEMKNSFEVARVLQDFLIEEGKELGIEIMDN